MPHILEGLVCMLPPDAGGRQHAVAPREGSYRPFGRIEGSPMLRLRFIEGPPQLAPGESGSVVVEVETDSPISTGAELELIEHDRVVGLLTVFRLWPSVAV